MKNNNKQYISYWIRNFLTHYMINIRNNSDNTRKSYRDCMKLFLPYIAKYKKKRVEALHIEDITSENITQFLNYIESDRGCSISTRNQRLAAIFAFAKYVSTREPEFMEWCRLLHTVHMKKISMPRIDGSIIPKLFYLERSEIDALLNAPNKNTTQGRRDYALLLFLYNSGARVSEVTSLKIGDLSYDNHSLSYGKVAIHGKGNKCRICPLWRDTIEVLKPLIDGRNSSENVFLNRYGNAITRHGIFDIVKKYAEKTSQNISSITAKRVSPHTIRHSTASHLLEAGVDINTIRAWLGHVSVDTTNIYAEVNIQMKANALKTCEIENNIKKKWKDDKQLMDFLINL